MPGKKKKKQCKKIFCVTKFFTMCFFYSNMEKTKKFKKFKAFKPFKCKASRQLFPFEKIL
jgi:hypothetical protein